MAIWIRKATKVRAEGNKPKIILEYFGRVNSATPVVSIAHMKSPGGWREPGQTPEFDEYTVVLKGMLQAETRTEKFRVRAGQAVLAPRGQWIRYSTPRRGGAEYLAVCLPAFSPATVHRDSVSGQAKKGKKAKG